MCPWLWWGKQFSLQKRETEKQIMCFCFTSSNFGLVFFPRPFGALKQNKNSLLHKHKTKWLLNKHFTFTPMCSVLIPITLQELDDITKISSHPLVNWLDGFCPRIVPWCVPSISYSEYHCWKMYCSTERSICQYILTFKSRPQIINSFSKLTWAPLFLRHTSSYCLQKQHILTTNTAIASTGKGSYWSLDFLLSAVAKNCEACSGFRNWLI